jgi:hypothetical protein
MMDRFPTNDDFIKASYQIITNKDGDTAMTLLSKYYREQCLDHPEKFMDFVNHATETYRNMYMFDMVS